VQTGGAGSGCLSPAEQVSIVQESLTNVLEHAGPTSVTVAIDYTPDAVRLEIRISGASRTDVVASEGHGLLGRRERASLCGGDLSAGREPDGGFAVRAALPLS
jgi:signal transduction histidine kinase